MLSIYALLALLGMANDSHIHGVVRDSSNRLPIAFVRVMVSGTNQGAITDVNGLFHLHGIDRDSASLSVSMVGYQPKIIVIDTRSSDRIEIELVQNERTIDINELKKRTSSTSTQNATTISMAELDEHRGQTFADALTVVPGVTVMKTGPSIGKPMVHGVSGTRLVLRNNGVVQEGQQWGAEHAPEIDPFTPAKITIVKGPSAVMYGPNAMGGAIDVEQRPMPIDNILQGEATVAGYANNYQGASSMMIEQGRLFNTPVSIRAQGTYRIAGDASTPDYRLTNTAFHEWTGSGTVYVGDVLDHVSMTYSYYGTSLGIFKGSHLGNATDLQRAIERGSPSPSLIKPFSYTIGNPHQSIAHAMFTARGRWQIDSIHALHVEYGYQQNDRSEFDAHNARIIGRGDSPEERAADSIARLNRVLQTPAMNLLLTTYSADAKLESHHSASLWGTFGVSGIRQVNDRSGSVYLIPDFTTLGLGAYALEELRLQSLTLSAGLRYDARHSDVTVRYRNQTASVQQTKMFSGLAGGFGVSYMIQPNLTVYSNLGIAWRPPQMNELYSNDVHHGVAFYEIGDSTMHEERCTGIDVGIEGTMSTVKLAISGYTNIFSSYILALPDPDNPTVTIRGTFPTYRFVQHAATISGIDLSADLPVASYMNIYTKGSIVRGNDRTLDGPLFLMPADRATLGVHTHWDDWMDVHDIFADVSVTAVRAQDRFAPDQDYALPPHGYALVNLSAGAELHLGSVPFTISMSVMNLFNQSYRDYLSRYRYFADDTGRDVIVRMKVPF